MPVCVPIKDLRDTAKFSELVKSTPGPITVTKNGYSEFVVMRAADYDAYAEQQALAHLREDMKIVERQRAEHDYLDFDEVMKEIREKHGL